MNSVSRSPTNPSSFDRPIVYLTIQDFRAPTGPSVNEREFWIALKESGREATGVMPASGASAQTSATASASTFSPHPANVAGQLVFKQVRLLQAASEVIERYKSQGKAPIVVVRMPVLPWSLLLLMHRYPDVPIFFKTVGDTEFLHRSKGLRHLLSTPLRPFQSWIVSAVLKRAAGIDVCTDNLKRYLASLYSLPESAFTVVPNSTNVRRFDPAEHQKTGRFDPGSFVIGYVGAHPYVRGGRQVIETLAALREEFPRVRGLVVGGDTQLLKAHAAKNGVGDICSIVDRVPYDQIPGLMAELDLLIATDEATRSADTGNSYQKIKQGLAMGIPIITNPDCEQMLIDAGMVETAEASDMTRIVATTKSIMSWPQARRDAFRRRSRAFMESQSNEATLEQRVAFWNSRCGAAS